MQKKNANNVKLEKLSNAERKKKLDALKLRRKLLKRNKLPMKRRKLKLRSNLHIKKLKP